MHEELSNGVIQSSIIQNKQQLMYIERGLYFIGNEVLLIYKKVESNKINIEDWKLMLGEHIRQQIPDNCICNEILVIKRYLESVYKYLVSLKDKASKSQDPSPRKRLRKVSNSLIANKSKSNHKSMIGTK